MRVRLRRDVLVGAVALVFPCVTVQACGPDFQPDVFVRTTEPDDLHAFAEGKLGILQKGYDSNEFAVAYRYLSGGTLSAEERAAYAPPPQPVKDWTNLTSEQIQACLLYTSLLSRGWNCASLCYRLGHDGPCELREHNKNQRITDSIKRVASPIPTVHRQRPGNQEFPGRCCF